LEKAAASLVANLRAFAWRRLLLFFLAFFPRAAIFTLLFDRQPDRESLNLNQTEKIGVAQHGAFVGFLFVNALERRSAHRIVGWRSHYRDQQPLRAATGRDLAPTLTISGLAWCWPAYHSSASRKPSFHRDLSGSDLCGLSSTIALEPAEEFAANRLAVFQPSA
jgi:hypothetical protein